MSTTLAVVGGYLILVAVVLTWFRITKTPAPKPARDDRPLLVALDDVDFDWPEHLPS